MNKILLKYQNREIKQCHTYPVENNSISKYMMVDIKQPNISIVLRQVDKNDRLDIFYTRLYI